VAHVGHQQIFLIKIFFLIFMFQKTQLEFLPQKKISKVQLGLLLQKPELKISKNRTRIFISKIRVINSKTLDILLQKSEI